MFKSEDSDTDDYFMYRFCTRPCTKKTKKRYRKPRKCFDPNSQVMRRRVPTQGEYGLYNYIPEPCPQWQKLKKCSMGESCPRAHGWLEVIFHPLLYKTKMCKSNLENGACRQYGIYCAKAHNPTEIRNLVKIYGENWKRHYDLSLRTKAGSSTIVKAQAICAKKSDTTQSIRRSMRDVTGTSDQAEAFGRTKRSPTLTNFRTVMDPQSPLLLTSPPLFGDYNSICDRITDLNLDGEVTSYAQLYGEKVAMVEKSYRSPIPKIPWDCIWHSPGTDVTSPESSSVSSYNSNFMTTLGDNWNSSDVCWKIDVKVSEWDKENQQSSIIEENAESLFAQPSYEGNWKEQEFF